jgi:hypothetical protein
MWESGKPVITAAGIVVDPVDAEAGIEAGAASALVHIHLAVEAGVARQALAQVPVHLPQHMSTSMPRNRQNTIK